MNEETLIPRYLAWQERVYHTCRQHWIVLARPFILWLGGLFLAAWVSVVVPLPRGIVAWVVIALLVAISAYFCWKVLEWMIARYVITDRRAFFIEGIVIRKVSAIPLSKVTDTTFIRTPLGQLLNYGDFLLDAPGEKPGLPTLTKLPDPDDVYRLVCSLTPEGEAEPPVDDV